MDLAEMTGYDEQQPAYEKVAASNGLRLHGFLHSMIEAALDVDRPLVTHSLIRALNFHAIAGLNTTAGQYRSHGLVVGDYVPPEPVRVQPMMDDCVDLINRRWERVDAITLAAWALWRINYIHPFINGNGRTARAVCYFIICVKVGGPLPGLRTLPDRLKDHRDVYIDALKLADQGNHLPLQLLIGDLLQEQLNE